MRRSCAPSVLAQKNTESSTERSRYSGRKRKRINFKETDSAENDCSDLQIAKSGTTGSDIVANYQKELTVAGVENVKMERFDDSIRAAHEAFIKKTLGNFVIYIFYF